MQKLEARTKKQKVIRISVGLVIAVVSLFGGAIGLVGVIVGLAIAGNAAFAKTKKV